MYVTWYIDRCTHFCFTWVADIATALNLELLANAHNPASVQSLFGVLNHTKTPSGGMLYIHLAVVCKVKCLTAVSGWSGAKHYSVLVYTSVLTLWLSCWLSVGLKLFLSLISHLSASSMRIVIACTQTRYSNPHFSCVLSVNYKNLAIIIIGEMISIAQWYRWSNCKFCFLD